MFVVCCLYVGFCSCVVCALVMLCRYLLIGFGLVCLWVLWYCVVMMVGGYVGYCVISL